MSLTLSGVWSLSLHLDLFNSVGRYSLTSCFQKWLTICCTFFCTRLEAGGFLAVELSWWEKIERSVDQKMVWRERHFSFSGRSETIVSSLEFNVALVSTKIVLNTSSDILLEPRMINRVRFAVWIKRSQIPPNELHRED